MDVLELECRRLGYVPKFRNGNCDPRFYKGVTSVGGQVRSNRRCRLILYTSSVYHTYPGLRGNIYIGRTGIKGCSLGAGVLNAKGLRGVYSSYV